MTYDSALHSYYSKRVTDTGYFADRADEPYRSTVHMHTFALNHGFFDGLDSSHATLDIACGTGSETAYLASKHPTLNFIGMDNVGRFIHVARNRYDRLTNLGFIQGDLFEAHEIPLLADVRACWFAQSIILFPDWREVLKSILLPQVDRIVLSTLAYEGIIESRVQHMLDAIHPSPEQAVHYNVLSIPAVVQHMSSLGFACLAVEPFEIDISLPRPQHRDLQSYTVRCQDGKNLIFSAWQNLPWHFMAFARS